MLLRLLLLLTLIPLVELALLVWIADRTSWKLALLLVIATGLAGAWMIRRAGTRCIRDIRLRLAHGQLPTAQLLDGLMILVAGVLLLTPGVLTDLLGLALLFPPCRQLLRLWLLPRVVGRVFRVGRGRSPRRGDRIIDVQVVDPRKDRDGTA